MNEGLDKQACMWGMLCHLIALAGFIVPFGNIVGPLIIWQLKKNEIPFVNEQGKESLNFQISMTIYALVAALLIFVVIGFIVLPIIGLVNLILVIIASTKANNGEAFTYPLTVRIIK